MSKKEVSFGKFCATPFKTNYQKGEHRCVGIELEVEAKTKEQHDIACVHMCPFPWRLESDGSLRYGVEFIASYPFPDDGLDSYIRGVYEHIHKLHLGNTLRTSTHVHVDCTDQNVSFLPGFCTTQILVEPLLMHVAGRMREECIYCIPWYRAANELERAILAIRHHKNTSPQYAVARINGSFNKYSSCYLGPLVTRGTVEFRHAPFFDAWEDCYRWVVTCRNLVEYSIGKTALDVWNHYEEAGPELWLQDVVPLYKVPSDYQRLLTITDVEAIAESFVRQAEDLDQCWDFPQTGPTPSSETRTKYFSRYGGGRRDHIYDPNKGQNVLHREGNEKKAKKESQSLYNYVCSSNKVFPIDLAGQGAPAEVIAHWVEDASSTATTNEYSEYSGTWTIGTL